MVVNFLLQELQQIILQHFVNKIMIQVVHLNLDPIKKKIYSIVEKKKKINRTCIIEDGSDSFNGFFIRD
jgi:hypothetical protein